MAAIAFDDVVQQVRTLSDEEQRRLRDLLNLWLAAPGSRTPEAELDRILLEKGVISSIPPGTADVTAYERWMPIEVKGKPLSEVIIEERR